MLTARRLLDLLCIFNRGCTGPRRGRDMEGGNKKAADQESRTKPWAEKSIID
jgi:hypothetical protein